jgi:hypothetical protein
MPSMGERWDLLWQVRMAGTAGGIRRRDTSKDDFVKDDFLEQDKSPVPDVTA